MNHAIVVMQVVMQNIFCSYIIVITIQIFAVHRQRLWRGTAITQSSKLNSPLCLISDWKHILCIGSTIHTCKWFYIFQLQCKSMYVLVTCTSYACIWFYSTKSRSIFSSTSMLRYFSCSFGPEMDDATLNARRGVSWEGVPGGPYAWEGVPVGPYAWIPQFALRPRLHFCGNSFW